MKGVIVIFILSISVAGFAQKTAKARLNKSTIVKDSSGVVYPYEAWVKMLETLEYKMYAVDSMNKKSPFIIGRASPEQTQKWKQQKQNYIESGMPPESRFFTTGSKFQWINHKTYTDISGFAITEEWLEGKTVVLNFWFIDCLPCRKEMPELDELARDYASDSSIVFLSVATDSKKAIKKVLEKTPFSYRIISNGVGITSDYGINTWPLNLVVSAEGVIVFHTSGYSIKTVPWMRKVIEGLKKAE